MLRLKDSSESQGWERFRNAIRDLYVVKKHKLEGPDGVIRHMEVTYGFKATKAQYEKKFRDWGLQKNRPGSDWHIVSQKIEMRNQNGKRSSVYLDERLLPTKKVKREVSRHGILPSLQHFPKVPIKSIPVPTTPPGFNICTPVVPETVRLVFKNLPIFMFQEKISLLADSVSPAESTSSVLSNVLYSHGLRQAKPILPFINAILPNSDFMEEDCAQGLAIKSNEDIGIKEFFSVMTFLISNNFPGETNGKQVLKWLQTLSNMAVIKAVVSQRGATGEALIETIFRLAVEAEDITFVKRLIQEGADPNGHACQHSAIPDTMSALQFACIRGNWELGIQLIEAGSVIDHPGTGWKSSALVLAIIGANLKRDFWDLDGVDEDHPVEDDQNVKEHKERFHRFIRYLMEKGAAVNPIVNESCIESSPLDDHELDPHALELETILYDGHSPLTVASKYWDTTLVDLFLQNQADIKFLTYLGTTALRECIYSSEDERGKEFYGRPEDYLPLSAPGLSEILETQRNVNPEQVTAVIRSLVDAGAGVNEIHRLCHLMRTDVHTHREEDDCYYTVLDKVMTLQNVELAESVLSAGACKATTYSLRLAIQMKDLGIYTRLVDMVSTVSLAIVQDIVGWEHSIEYIEALLAKTSNLAMKQAILFKAIEEGEIRTIDYMLNLSAILAGHFIFMIPTEHYLRGSFRSAVSGDNQAIFHTLLRAGADVDEVCNGGTALEAAIENKNYDTVLWLLDLEARPNTQTKSYQEVGNDNQGKYCKAYHKLYGNPLVMAIFWGRSDVVERLCKAGANLNALGCHVLRPGEYACRCILPVTAALKVKNYTLFHSLIGMGAAINNPPGSSPDSATPLEVVIKSHSLGDVHAFLQIGANPYDYEAVKYARDHPEVFQVLLESMRNWSAHLSSTELGDAALITVARLCNKETVSILLDSSPENTISTHGLSLALLEALTSEGTAGLEIVTILLRHGADPNSVYGPEGDCPQSAVCLSINKSSLEYLDLLLKAGAKENASLASVSRCLPLQTGVINGNQDIVCKLLKEGWNPDAFAGIRGYSYLGTPLQIAVGKQVYNTEIIKLLLRHKCNVEATCEDNPHTALQIASRDGKKEIVELLYQYGANVNAPAAEEYGATALQFAAIQGYLGIATLLIDYEADVNAPAAEFDGRTALEGAAEHGRIDMVQLLLNAGATIVQEGDTQYQNAMRRASQNGHLAIRRLLEAARPMDEPESVVDLADADVMNWTSGEQPATDSTNQSDSGANLIDELQFDALEQTVGEPYFTDQPPLIDMDQGEWDWNGIYDL